MNNAACCDTQFLTCTDPNQDQLEAFVKLLIRAREAECAIWVDGTWTSAFRTSGGILDFNSRSIGKELRAQIISQLGKMSQSDSPCCEARSTESDVLLLLPEIRDVSDILCDGTCVNVRTATSELEFQSFWRELLRRFAATADDFERLLRAAFFRLEFGPRARNRWDRMGYKVSAVRGTLVDHLAYLCDQARSDWIVSGYRDGEFEARAPVLLSCDSSSKRSRAYPDTGGNDVPCRHHTKLHPDGSGQSAHHPGRIYFCVERGDIVFVGRVCEHD